jgi:SOS-response transcriptional repressor LexA
MRQPLSPRQVVVLDTIRRLTRERGFPPTYRELARALDIRSTNAVKDHLLALQRKGWLRCEASTSRSMVITGDEVPTAPESAGIRRIPGRPGQVVLEVPVAEAVRIRDWLQSRLSSMDLGTGADGLLDALQSATGGRG